MQIYLQTRVVGFRATQIKPSAVVVGVDTDVNH